MASSPTTTNFPNGITSFGEVVYGGITTHAGPTYFVSRNVTASGDGTSWNKAFKTISEGIAKLNSDYTDAVTPSKGRNAFLYIGEGYYSEVPVSLTCNDATIIATAPGTHDSTVWYGSGTAGSFAGTTTAPLLTITGHNNTIINLGFVNISGGLQPAVQIGTASAAAISNKFISCKITKDVADSVTYGFEDFGNAYTEWHDCEFTTSVKTAGIRIRSGVTNGIQQRINNCRFYGTPSGILVDAAAHQLLIENCVFTDDTSDTADVIDTPILNNGGVRIIVRDCYAVTSTANMVTGAGTSWQANLFTFTSE